MRIGKTGVREAKACLSKLIRDVQRGKEWLMQERIGRLEDSGLIEPPRRRVRRLPAPLPIEKELAQRWLQEDRSA